MKFIKILLLAGAIGLVAGAIGYNWISAKYPSCELVTKGIAVSTYGCSNGAHSETTACENKSPNSAEMISCVNNNYYRYKTVPFGFTQKFGDQSNLIDPMPKTFNALAMFGTGFVLTLGALLLRRKLTSRVFIS